MCHEVIAEQPPDRVDAERAADVDEHERIALE